HLHRVVVVAVVRRELEMPLQLTGVGIERDDAVRVEVVAGTLTRIPVRTGVPDAPVREIQRRIVRAGDPHRRAAVLPIVAPPGIATPRLFAPQQTFDSGAGV